MAAKWKTAARGIRYREHPIRKHGVRPDRYFTLRFTVNGARVEEALGWASEGWTVALAQEELGRLHRAQRTGEGHVTLRAGIAAKQRAEQERAEEAAAQERRQKTVTALWERYAKEVVALENKPRTAAEKIRMWGRRIRPAIGDLQVNNVTAEDASAIVRAPYRLDEVGRIIRGRAEARNLYRLLHHMFRKALVWGLRQKDLGNPLENMSEPKVPRRERLLAGGEVGALLRALDEIALEKKASPQVIAVIRATFLTGARIGELLNLKWQDIRRDEMELHLPDTKTGFSRRPISEATLTLLDGVRRMPGSDFVFRDARTPTEPLSYDAVKGTFRRMVRRAGVQNCSLHTIRHWFSTMTANSVSNPRVGMALTGHKSHAVYMRYVHSDKEQAHALAEQLAAFTNTLAGTGSNVAVMSKKQS